MKEDFDTLEEAKAYLDKILGMKGKIYSDWRNGYQIGYFSPTGQEIIVYKFTKCVADGFCFNKATGFYPS
jgi:hypothetical protein